MLPSMPVLFPRESQSGDGFSFAPVPAPSRAVEPELTVATKPLVLSGLTEEPCAVPDDYKKDEKKNEPETEKEEDIQEIRFVTSYYNKVQAKLGIEKFTKFKEILNQFKAGKESPTELYRRLEVLFGNGELLEEFLTFLTPGQACEVGRLMDHMMLTKITKFIHCLQTTFARKPAKLRKVMKAVMSNLTADSVQLKARVEPHIRTSQRLLQQFRALFPEHRPPDSLYTDDLTEEFPESAWAEDQGRHCIDLEEASNTNRNDSTKNSPDVTYLHGRVFFQQGRMLRPARVTFPGSPLPLHAHAHRLAPPPAPHLTAPPPAPDSDDERSPRRKNVKSPKRTNIMKKEKNKSPERLGKNTSEIGKKPIRVVLDAQIEAKSIAAEMRRLPENGTTVKLNNDELEISHTPDYKEVVRTRRKRDHSPDTDVKASEDVKKPSKKNVKRLDMKKTEESHEENGKSKAKSVLDRPKNKKEPQKKNEVKQEKEKIEKEDVTKPKSDLKTFSDTDFIKPKPKETKTELQQKCDWTREEDKTILLILKREAGTEETFTKMKELLPHRTLTELQERFFHVMDLLRQMALGEVT